MSGSLIAERRDRRVNQMRQFSYGRSSNMRVGVTDEKIVMRCGRWAADAR